MPISENRILFTLDHDASLGQLVDEVSRRLGHEIWFRGESREHDIPANPVLAREKGHDLTPIEPNYDDGTYSFPLRVITVGERLMIEEIQRNPPADPYFPSLLTQPNHPGLDRCERSGD